MGSLLWRITHRLRIRHVCLPLQTKPRSHRCHGNHLHQPTKDQYLRTIHLSSTMELQHDETNLVSAEDCKAYWGPRRITDRMQCIGGNSINSGCMGGSGGPLVVTDPDDGITYLVGNTSFGTSDCSTSAPGMWSKNVVVKDWIDSFISA